MVLGLPRPPAEARRQPRTVGSRHGSPAASQALVGLAPLTARPKGADGIHPSSGDSLLTPVSAEPLLAPVMGVEPSRAGRLLPGPGRTSAFRLSGTEPPSDFTSATTTVDYPGMDAGETGRDRGGPVTGPRCEPAA